MVDQFGLPSMPKREIVGNLIEKLIVEDQRGRLLERRKRIFSIIILSLKSNLLLAGMSFSYMIQVLSLS